MAFFLKGNGARGSEKERPPEVLPDLPLISPAPPLSPSDGSSTSWRRPLEEFDAPLWHLGWTDGRLGQGTTENEAVLKSYSEALRQRQVDSLQGRLAVLKGEVSAGEELLPRIAQVSQGASDRLSQVSEARSAHLQEYSPLLGLIYLLIGVLLLLSDVPLSLRLVAEGYDIPISADLPGGGVVLIGEIFVQPGLVLRYLWEPLVLALGIALSGMFMKIFIDETILKQEPAVSRKVKIFFYVVAALFVFTLMAVGLFRSERQASALEESEVFSEESLGGGAMVDDSMDSSSAVAEESLSGWGSLSFLSLTLMLPLVGAVCFLSGWSRLKKWSYYWELKLVAWYSGRQHARELAILAAKRGEAESLASMLQRLIGERDAQADLWRNLYRHGYLRGAAVPETLNAEDTLYQRCERDLKKQMAVDSRRRLWSQIDKDSMGGVL